MCLIDPAGLQQSPGQVVRLRSRHEDPFALVPAQDFLVQLGGFVVLLVEVGQVCIVLVLCRGIFEPLG